MVNRPIVESVDDRLVGLMRLILALSALTIIYIDPSEPDRLVGVTYGALVLYSLYSGGIYFLHVKRPSVLQGFPLHWIDVGWYVLLLSLSSGTNSVFFFFFFFVILVASFRSGYEAGLSVTVVSATLFVTIGYLTTHSEIEPNRFFLRPIYLVTIGYLMAYWGGSEITHKRRLALLKDVNRLSNPRFGVDQTIGSIMSQLRAFYEADACLLIMAASESNKYLLRRASRRHPERASRVEVVGSEMESLLLAWPAEWAVTYHSRSNGWWFNKAACTGYIFTSGERAKDAAEACPGVADLLAAGSFINIPLYRQGKLSGRLYVTSKGRRFTYSDVDFLRQMIEHVMPMIDNIRLVDKLVSEAAERERQRISHDIHDSAIQPYIGLKFGLDALRRKVAPGDPLSGDIEELVDKTSGVIKDLRQYVGGLQDHDSADRGNILSSSIRRQALKFGELYGIEVALDIATEVNVKDRLAAEVFQIVQEGLSNIKRHTTSLHARISLASRDGELFLDIENHNSNVERPSPFTPLSIKERVLALGGRVGVNVRDDGRTIVSVIIPL
jgi:signal transduction histidine kinase